MYSMRASVLTRKITRFWRMLHNTREVKKISCRAKHNSTWQFIVSIFGMNFNLPFALSWITFRVTNAPILIFLTRLLNKGLNTYRHHTLTSPMISYYFQFLISVIMQVKILSNIFSKTHLQWWFLGQILINN